MSTKDLVQWKDGWYVHYVHDRVLLWAPWTSDKDILFVWIKPRSESRLLGAHRQKIFLFYKTVLLSVEFSLPVPFFNIQQILLRPPELANLFVSYFQVKFESTWLLAFHYDTSVRSLKSMVSAILFRCQVCQSRLKYDRPQIGFYKHKL